MKEHERIVSAKAVNGCVFNIGDRVIHEGSHKDDTAEITGFYWDMDLEEVRAYTTRGHAGLDYLSKI